MIYAAFALIGVLIGADLSRERWTRADRRIARRLMVGTGNHTPPTIGELRS